MSCFLARAGKCPWLLICHLDKRQCHQHGLQSLARIGEFPHRPLTQRVGPDHGHIQNERAVAMQLNNPHEVMNHLITLLAAEGVEAFIGKVDSVRY